MGLGRGERVDVALGDARLLRVDERIERPLDDLEPLVVALPHRGPEHRFADALGQDHLAGRAIQRAPHGIEPAGGGRDRIAEPLAVGNREILAILVENFGVGRLIDEGEIGEVGELVALVESADLEIVELIGRDDVEPAGHHEGLPVIKARCDVADAVTGIAPHGPVGVARNEVDVAGLELGETCIALERPEFELRRIAEDRGGDGPAEIDVEARSTDPSRRAARSRAADRRRRR